jgi:uncharacterized protein YndB with AHSA1/START domain
MAPRKNNPPPAGRGLEITRIFNAPRELVFAAWTEGKHLQRWCAPEGVTVISSAGDCRPGGAWRSCMLSPAGIKFPLSGVYRDVVPHELLSFTHAWEDPQGRRGHETLVTVRFFDHGEKTKVVFRQAVFNSTASRNGHADGWDQCLEKLRRHLATQQVKKQSHARRKS